MCVLVETFLREREREREGGEEEEGWVNGRIVIRTF
jgi:hypothetical protein